MTAALMWLLASSAAIAAEANRDEAGGGVDGGVNSGLNGGFNQSANQTGQALFRANCAECHQTNGQGIANVYPALAGSETVLGSGLDVALVMIIGRGEMPSFAGVLSSTEMAAIINYVRNSWGNSGTPISPDAIEQLQ